MVHWTSNSVARVERNQSTRCTKATFDASAGQSEWAHTFESAPDSMPVVVATLAVEAPTEDAVRVTLARDPWHGSRERT